MNENTPRNFALQLGALISLYLSISFFLVLLFGIINTIFPDAADTQWSTRSHEGQIRFGIAMVVVFFPVYLYLTRIINKIRRTEPSGAYLTLTKWLIYLSLVVGGGVLLGDLVAVIMSYLEGEITTRFTLKALSVLVVVGAAFYYYLRDAQGYWITREKQSVLFGVISAVVVLGVVISGFMNARTPDEVREARLDDQQISDLQEIQWQIEQYYRMNDELPQSITAAYEDLTAPTAPEGRPGYSYTLSEEIVSDRYELCATFAFDSTNSTYERPVTIPATIYDKGYDWSHEAGEWCFSRNTKHLE